MNVYIYGNQSFKKEIHDTLEHANIKFKLDVDTKIEEIDSLDILKKRIIENPSDIYLIDEAKIIKNNIINQKIKFLNPKDAIEEEFLFENGVADLSVDSLSEIPKYILKKYESLKADNSEIEESIIEIVDEAYNENSETEEDDFEKIELDEELELLLSSSSTDDSFVPNDTGFDENVGLSNISSDYDDDHSLDDLLDSTSDNDFALEEDEKLDPKFENELNSELEYGLAPNDEDENEDFNLEDIEALEQLEEPIDKKQEEQNNELEFDITDDINEEVIENEVLSNEIEGKNMIDDEFSQLDSLNEVDILDALSNMGTVETKPHVKKVDTPKEEKVSIEGSNVNDIAELISKLLNNKTLEITIKIKD